MASVYFNWREMTNAANSFWICLLTDWNKVSFGEQYSLNPTPLRLFYLYWYSGWDSTQLWIVGRRQKLKMFEASFSDDPDEWENFNYFIALGIHPFVACAEKSVRSVSSKLGKSPIFSRDFCRALHHFAPEYFEKSPKYSKFQFKGSFWVSHSALNILKDVLNSRGIFVQCMEALKKRDIHARLRMMEALRMLAYDNAADELEECLQMSDDPGLLTEKRFYKKAMKLFGEEYLRHPKEAEMCPILCIHEVSGFPGCIGIINSRHWQERNLRLAWPRQ